MRYYEIQPRPPLSRYLECFWVLEGSPKHRAAVPERILPDGCAELILNFAAPFREQKENGRTEQQPRRILVGQMTKPVLIAPTGTTHLLGIRFHPGGTRAFFPVPMLELTDRITELQALAPGLDRDVAERAGEAESFRKRVEIVERALTRRIIGDGARRHSLWGSVRQILRSSGQVSVDGLAAGAGVSARQLERRFLNEVGLGPKLLCRILRFQRVFRAVEKNEAGWAAVAADCGYYDQAHLIRDFQQFSGETPSLLFARTSKLTEVFTRKNRVSDFSNTGD